MNLPGRGGGRNSDGVKVSQVGISSVCVARSTADGDTFCRRQVGPSFMCSIYCSPCLSSTWVFPRLIIGGVHDHVGTLLPTSMMQDLPSSSRNWVQLFVGLVAAVACTEAPVPVCRDVYVPDDLGSVRQWCCVEQLPRIFSQCLFFLSLQKSGKILRSV